MGADLNKLVLGVPWYGYIYQCQSITKVSFHFFNVFLLRKKKLDNVSVFFLVLISSSVRSIFHV